MFSDVTFVRTSFSVVSDISLLPLETTLKVRGYFDTKKKKRNAEPDAEASYPLKIKPSDTAVASMEFLESCIPQIVAGNKLPSIHVG